MENVIKELKERLAILNILANQRGFSKKKKESKKLIPEYENAISILERSMEATNGVLNDRPNNIPICPKCENPYPHSHTDGSYSCEECGNKWA